MKLESRQISSSRAAEVYLSATPEAGSDPAREAGALFTAIAQEASRLGGRIGRQRAFVPEGCLEAYRQAWRVAGGAGEAGTSCNWLSAGAGAAGGVQAHVIAGAVAWTPLLDASGAPAGWACKNGKARWVLSGGIVMPREGDGVATTRKAFEAARRLLAQADMGLSDVARTWFFLDNLLAWYGQFNAGRNEVFREQGLLAPGAGSRPNVPASTGISVAPAGGGRLAMEIFAVAGQEGCILRRPAAGKQDSAYKYGSAFARASQALTPGGRTVFVSGTAAIDERGRSCFLGNPAGQIRMTLDNVQAVLSDMQCSPSDVVETVAYCKTPAIAAQFAKDFRHTLNWPWVVAVCDVCRDDLLFEVEATAGRGE